MIFNQKEFLHQEARAIICYQGQNRIKSRYDAVLQWDELGLSFDYLLQYLKDLNIRDPEELMKKLDWCSCSSDALLGVSISSICELHDLLYTVCQSKKDRLRADRLLRDRIYKKLIDHKRSKIRSWLRSRVYYIGVRMFGKSHYNKML